VSRLIKGIFKEKHKPLAAETPMRNPVKEPGPFPTAIAFKSLKM